VGAQEPATWVYVKTDDKDESGIYRCVAENGVVRCQRAEMASN
jgi:hypothetical protein